MQQKSHTSTLVTLLICLILYIPFQAYGQSKYYSQGIKAQIAFNEKDYSKAIRIYNNLIKKGIATTNSYPGRAKCYVKIGEYDKAIADYRFLIDHSAPDYKYYEKIAAIELKRNNPEGEQRIISEGIERFDSPELIKYRGNIHKRNKNHVKMMEDYSLAFNSVKGGSIKTNHKYFFLMYLGFELLDMNEGGMALEIAEYALKELEFEKSEPDLTYRGNWKVHSQNMYMIKSKALIETDKYEDAEATCELLIKNNDSKSGKSMGHRVKGIARMHRYNFEGALESFRWARTFYKFPISEIPYFEGECYYQLGEYDLASRKFEEMSKISRKPAISNAYYTMARYKAGRIDDAVPVLDNLIKQNPDKGEILFVKARVLGAQDKTNEAYDCINKSVNKGFNDRSKIIFGLTDLQAAISRSSDNILASRFDIQTPARKSKITVRNNLIFSPPYSGNEKRLALIIGNGLYEYGGILANPENDATDMASVLEHLGFEVIKYENTDQSTLKRAIDEFGYRLKLYDAGLFFYAGHGIQAKGQNYLIPVDAHIQNESDVEFTCVDAGRILTRMEDANNRINIIILDACRDNPFERSWTRSTHGRGLAKMDAPKGSIIAYATEPGNTASDGSGRNGLYTEALLEEMQTPGIIIEKVFRQARTRVLEQSGEKQTPWESTSLTGDFYFLNK